MKKINKEIKYVYHQDPMIGEISKAQVISDVKKKC